MSMQRNDAAVLVPLLVAAESETSLLFIHRTQLGLHGGQISFPGGMSEGQDPDPQATALREFEEELGVSRDVVEVLKILPTMQTLSTGLWVTPVIGRITAPPRWMPDPVEVAEVLVIGLSELTEPANRSEIAVRSEKWAQERRFPCIEAGGHRIWGLTYRILEKVLPDLQDFRPDAG